MHGAKGRHQGAVLGGGTLVSSSKYHLGDCHRSPERLDNQPHRHTAVTGEDDIASAGGHTQNTNCTARRGGITHLRFLTQQLHESIIHIMWAPSEIAYRWVPCVFRRAGNVCAYMPLRAVSRGGQAQLGDAGGSSHEPHNNWLWLRRGVQDVHAADEKTSAQLPCAATG